VTLVGDSATRAARPATLRISRFLTLVSPQVELDHPSAPILFDPVDLKNAPRENASPASDSSRTMGSGRDLEDRRTIVARGRTVRDETRAASASVVNALKSFLSHRRAEDRRARMRPNRLSFARDAELGAFGRVTPFSTLRACRMVAPSEMDSRFRFGQRPPSKRATPRTAATILGCVSPYANCTRARQWRRMPSQCAKMVGPTLRICRGRTALCSSRGRLRACRPRWLGPQSVRRAPCPTELGRVDGGRIRRASAPRGPIAATAPTGRGVTCCYANGVLDGPIAVSPERRARPGVPVQGRNVSGDLQAYASGDPSPERLRGAAFLPARTACKRLRPGKSAGRDLLNHAGQRILQEGIALPERPAAFRRAVLDPFSKRWLRRVLSGTAPATLRALVARWIAGRERQSQAGKLHGGPNVPAHRRAEEESTTRRLRSGPYRRVMPGRASTPTRASVRARAMDADSAIGVWRFIDVDGRDVPLPTFGSASRLHDVTGFRSRRSTGRTVGLRSGRPRTRSPGGRGTVRARRERVLPRMTAPGYERP